MSKDLAWRRDGSYDLGKSMTLAKLAPKWSTTNSLMQASLMRSFFLQHDSIKAVFFPHNILFSVTKPSLTLYLPALQRAGFQYARLVLKPGENEHYSENDLVLLSKENPMVCLPYWMLWACNIGCDRHCRFACLLFSS